MTYLSCAMGHALLCVENPQVADSVQVHEADTEQQELFTFTTCRTSLLGVDRWGPKPHFAQLTCIRVPPNEHRRHHGQKEPRNR